jgi:SPP1 gp7 family putative phage head morphogenesis protein
MLKDKGYVETEELLYELTAELESIYGQAYDELYEKAQRFLSWFVAADEIRRKLFENGELTKEEYQQWRRTSMLTGRQAYSMLDTIATDLTNVNLLASSIINGYMPEVYAVNVNWTEYAIEKELKVSTSFTLFNEQAVERLVREKPDLLPKAKVDIPKDKQWNKQQLNSAITQGIIQGDTVDEIAQRLADVTDMDKNAAVRNAATMTTSAQNGGREGTYKRAEDMGIVVKREWIATLDGHTRPTHRKCDGEIRAIGEKFSNGLEFPGDPKGEPAEIYNCRCMTGAVVEKSKVDLSDRDFRELDRWDMNYDEWKERKGSTNEQMTRAARNVNDDMKMHKEYKKLLGNKIPSRFKDFQELKYKHPKEWKQMVSEARKARNNKRGR